MQLLITTACRRSDLVQLGPRNVVGSGGSRSLTFQQAKHGYAEESQVTVPITPDLERALGNTATGDETFLVTEYGKPLSDKGFGSKMRKWCDDAGLPKGLSCHGVRKAIGAHLADAGCTEHEIMSFHGHTAPQESEKYTRTANRKIMARNAAQKAGIGISFARSTRTNSNN